MRTVLLPRISVLPADVSNTDAADVLSTDAEHAGGIV